MAVTRVSHSFLLIEFVPICSSVVTTLGLKRKAIMETFTGQVPKEKTQACFVGYIGCYMCDSSVI